MVRVLCCVHRKCDSNNKDSCTKFSPGSTVKQFKGHVKLIEWVKIAILFLHVTSKLIRFTILNLSESFYVRLSKNFSKQFTNKSKITYNDVSFIESFQLTLKFHSFIPPNEK